MASGSGSIPPVDIDEGTFKYVLIKVTGTAAEMDAKDNCMYVVRGNQSGEYHADIFEEFEENLYKNSKTMRAVCTGGGRIKHTPSKKHIVVYGYSQGFGRADHALTCKLLKTKYPDYNIEWNNDGY